MCRTPKAVRDLRHTVDIPEPRGACPGSGD